MRVCACVRRFGIARKFYGNHRVVLKRVACVETHLNGGTRKALWFKCVCVRVFVVACEENDVLAILMEINFIIASVARVASADANR